MSELGGKSIKTFVFQWIKTKDIIVMEEPADVKEKNKGDLVKVMYGRKFYEAILLQRSGT